MNIRDWGAKSWCREGFPFYTRVGFRDKKSYVEQTLQCDCQVLLPEEGVMLTVSEVRSCLW